MGRHETNLGNDESGCLQFSDSEDEDGLTAQEKQQQEKTFHWYHRLGRPPRKIFMKRVQRMIDQDGYCDIQPSDVETLLPWSADGTRCTMATPRIVRQKRVQRRLGTLRDSLVLNYYHHNDTESDSDESRNVKETRPTPLKKTTTKQRKAKAVVPKKEVSKKKLTSAPSKSSTKSPKSTTTKSTTKKKKTKQPQLLVQKDSSPAWTMAGNDAQNDSTTSMNSTMTAVPQDDEPKTATTTRHSSFPLKRKVRFDTFATRHDNTLYSTRDIPDLWLALDKYKDYKQEIVQSVLDLWAHEDLLEEEREAAEREQQGNDDDDDIMPSYLNVLEQVYDACGRARTEQEMDEALADQLRQVFDYDAYLQCVGLEKHAMEHMVDDKLKRRKALYATVRQLQDTRAEELSDDELLQQLQRQCSEQTRPQRLFARYLAEAQQD